VRRHPPHHLSPAEQNHPAGRDPWGALALPTRHTTLQSSTKASHFCANSRPMGRNPEFRVMGSKLLLLRQPAHVGCSPGGGSLTINPVAVAISNSSSRTPDRAGPPYYPPLRTSGLHPFGTVLKIRSFRVTYEPLRNEVLPILSGRREPPISKLIIAGSDDAWSLSTDGIGSRLGDQVTKQSG
jgi:hypothetical protein